MKPIAYTLEWIPHLDRDRSCCICHRDGVYLLRRKAGRRNDMRYCGMHVRRQANLVEAEPLDDCAMVAMGIIKRRKGA